MGVKVRPQITCPYCHYRQSVEDKKAKKGQKKKRRAACSKCKQSLKGVREDWWLFIDHAGKKKAKKMKSKDAAEKVAKKADAKLALGEFNIEDPDESGPEIPSFKEYSDHWMDTYVKLNLSPSTQHSYEQNLRNHAWPALGHLPLDKIERKHIRELITQKKKDGLARDTVRLIHTVCHSPLELAVEDELIATNPARGMGKYNRRRPESDEPMKPFSERELDQFLDTVEDHWSDYHPLFFTLARTGLRVGEGLGLNWEDVDFQDRSLLVRRTYSEGTEGPPKGRRIRKVDLTPDTVSVLRDHQLKVGTRGAEPVFPSKNGGRMDYNNLRERVLLKALKKANLAHRGFHDFRHTYASLLLMKGVNVLYVSQQMGHKSVDITLKRYARWVPSDERKEVDRLDSRKPNETQAKPENGTSFYEDAASPSSP